MTSFTIIIVAQVQKLTHGGVSHRVVSWEWQHVDANVCCFGAGASFFFAASVVECI